MPACFSKCRSHPAPGQGWHIYNGYCQQLTVEATSAAETVTVFLRSKTLWPFKHNDAYWDDAVLEVVEEPPSGRGQPRVQYERTYVLVPGNAGRDVMAAVASAAWPRRWTIGCSADDAGIGDLDVRRVILLDPQAWGGIEALQAFFEEYYPGVKVVYLNTSCSEAEYQPTSPMNWYQAVGRVLAARLLAEGFRLRYPTTHFERPAVTSEFGEDRDTYFHNGLDLRSSWSAYGDQVLSATSGEVVVAGWVDDEPWFGYQVRVRTTTPAGTELLVRYAHLVKGSIAVSVGDQVNVSDVLGKPDNTGSSYGDHLHIDVKVVGEPYNLDCHQHPYADPWPLLVGLPSHVVLPEPPPPEPPEPPEPPTGGLVSLHIQGGAHGDLEFVRRAKPAALKYVFGIERARGAKATLPSTLVVYRHWVPNQDQYLNHPGGVRRGARAYLETFLDALKANADWVDFAESLNEMVATGDVAGTQRLAEFDAAFAEVLAEEVGDAVRPALLTVAVGNPGENEVELLLPAVEAAVKYQGVLCYHAYWGVGPDGYCTMDTDWKWYAGRALEVWDPVFRAHGLYPRYLFTEGGAVAITGPGGAMNPGAGWRHETCLRGSWDKYLAQILEFRRRVQEWNRQHNNRCLGMTLFTVGGGAEWKWFELGDKLGALADALAS